MYMTKTSWVSLESCVVNVYSATACDEHGGMVGTAITEDSAEESAGDTLDEPDWLIEVLATLLLSLEADGSEITEEPGEINGHASFEGFHDIAVGPATVYSGYSFESGDLAEASSDLAETGEVEFEIPEPMAIESDGWCVVCTKAC